jgi:hypothetical protein
MDEFDFICSSNEQHIATLKNNVKLNKLLDEKAAEDDVG